MNPPTSKPLVNWLAALAASRSLTIRTLAIRTLAIRTLAIRTLAIRTLAIRSCGWPNCFVSSCFALICIFSGGVLLVAAGGCSGTVTRPNSAAAFSNSKVSDPPASDKLSSAGSVYLVERGQLKCYSNFFLPPTHPLIEELVELRAPVLQAVDLSPSNEPIQVYLFRSPAELAQFTSQTGDPILHRRAYFLQTADSLNVYASWSYDVQDDLRHELTHGYLHSVCPNIPLWLDEGLAEYFEVPSAERGVHLEHLKRLHAHRQAERLNPSLQRLTQLKVPAEFSQMDYALSWLWVAYLLSEPNTKEALARHIAAWQTSDTTEPPAFLEQLARKGFTEDELQRNLLKFLDSQVRRHRHRL